MLLASSGAKVTIYEAQSRVGGRTSRLTLEDGRGRPFHFDLGPTFFLMPYVLEEVFAAAGRDLHEEAELKPLDPMYRLVIGRQDDPGRGHDPWVIDTTTDLDEMARRISQIHPPDGVAFGRFVADNRRKLAAAEPILRKPIRTLLDLVNAESAKAAPHINPHLSVHKLLGKYFDHPATKMATSFQSKYLGMSPYECPSLFTILPFIEYEYGVWHPVGGCNALMDAMARVCIDLGVTIRCNMPVDELVFDESQKKPRLEAIIAGGERHEHDHAVVNADATWALKNLVPERLRSGNGGRHSDAKLDAKSYSCSTCMLYLGVEGEVDLPHHTIYVSEDYEKNLEGIGSGQELTDDPSFYVCNPSATDPSLAPEGDSAVYVLLPTSNLRERDDWDAVGGATRDHLYAQMERRLGLADLRDRVVAERFYTPRDWAGHNINFGATFNLAHNLGQMLHKRPHHRVQGFDGLWLVGGGTHPGSGLPVIFLSSQITSKLLCDETGLAYAGTAFEIDTNAGATRSRELLARNGLGMNHTAAAPVSGPSHASKAGPKGQTTA